MQTYVFANRSFLLCEFLLDWVWNGQIHLQDLCHQHFDDLVLVLFVILLNFGNLLLSILLKLSLEFLISFLDKVQYTSALICSNSAYFYFLYLATSSSAASLAYFNFLCLNEDEKRQKFFVCEEWKKDTFISELFRWCR